MSLLEDWCGWGRGGTPCPCCSGSEMFPLARVPVLLPKGPGDVVLPDTCCSCPTAWWGRGRGQAASLSQGKCLRLGSHKLSLRCLCRFLPGIQKFQEELKQPRPPALPRLQLPACDAQPSGMVWPRDFPALWHISGLWTGAEEAARAANSPSPPALPEPEETNAAFVVCAWPPGNELPPRREGRKTAPAADGVQAPKGGSGTVAPLPCQENGAERGARPGMACTSQPPGKGHFPSLRPGTVTAAVLWPRGQAGLFCLPAALQEQLSLRPQAETCRWPWHRRSVSCPYLSARGQHRCRED